jgi:hypothetical protein
VRDGLAAVQDEQQRALAAEIGDEELEECVDDECLRRELVVQPAVAE